MEYIECFSQSESNEDPIKAYQKISICQNIVRSLGGESRYSMYNRKAEPPRQKKIRQGGRAL